MPSSTATKPPQQSPTFIKTSRLHKCKGRPNTLTHASLQDPSFTSHPVSCRHLFKLRSLSLNLLKPLANTLFASIQSSNSNKSKDPLKTDTCSPYLNCHVPRAQIFNAQRSETAKGPSPNFPIRHLLSFSSLSCTSPSPI